MAYLGNQPALSYTSFAKQDFTTSATTSYTLDNPVANANELALFINFVRQEPTTAYSASGTSLTLTSATSASDDMYCVFLGKAVQTVNPPNASVGLSQLTATGTKDSTTFLRGDNTFASAGGTNTPTFHARTSTSQSLTRNTDVKIVNFVTDFDTATGFSSNTYTIPTGEGGKYCIYFSLSINSGVAGADGETVRGRVFKNGSYLNGFQSILQDNGGFNMYIANYSANFIGVATLSAGDTLDLHGYTADQNNSGSIESNSHTIFGAYKIIE